MQTHWSRLNSLTIRQLTCGVLTVCRLLEATHERQTNLAASIPTVSALVAERERVTELTLLEQWGMSRG